MKYEELDAGVTSQIKAIAFLWDDHDLFTAQATMKSVFEQVEPTTLEDLRKQSRALDRSHRVFGRHPPKISSNLRATPSTISSLQGAAAICTPIGKPVELVPHRTTAAGQPVKLCVIV
jgi:hypothetical protein